MTKVKFLTRSASANGVIQVGEVVEVPDNEARLLIDGKFAVLAEPAVSEEELVAEPEADVSIKPKHRTAKGKQNIWLMPSTK